MERSISANGIDAFWLRPGRHILSFEGTPDASTVVALKAGSDSAGANHVAITSAVSDAALEFVTGGAPEPEELTGGMYYSLVTTDFGASTGLKASFRYIGQAS